MPEFENAYEFVLGYEGGYSNDPIDRGGETYKGIARRYSKTWAGWLIIDTMKSDLSHVFPECLVNNIILDQLVKKRYKDIYWDTLLLDDILSQDLANELFDISVNMGYYRSGKFLQIALNAMNRNQSLYNDIVVDGKVGDKTIEALEKYFIKDSSNYLIKIINILQGNHYIEFMKKSTEQERFARGWLNRVVLIKNKM